MWNALRTKRGSRKDTAQIMSIETRLAEARASIARHREKMGEQVLAVENDEEGSVAALRETRAALEAAKAKVAELEAALSVARDRHAHSEAADQEAELQRQWGRSDELGDQRIKHAKNLAGLLDDVAKEYRALVDVSMEFRASIPEKHKHFDSYDPYNRGALETLLRMQLFLAGFEFAGPYLFVDELPRLVEKVKSDNEWAFKGRTAK